MPLMKPMLFNTEMVRAMMAGDKTATRRLLRPQFPTYKDREPGRFSKIEPYGRASFIATHEEKPNMRTIISPPVLPGDILYVRETWGEDKHNWIYKADFTDSDLQKIESITRWRPSIHMPKKAARLFLRVTDVRVERLRDSFGNGYGQAERFQREGITLPEECANCIEAYGCPCCSDLDDSLPYDEHTGEDSEGGSECGMLDDVRNDFALLWDSTVAPDKRDTYGWSANPWVWVIEFERIMREEAYGN